MQFFINKIVFGSKSPKKGFVIAVGIFLVALLILSALARYHVKVDHEFKIQKLEGIRLALVFAHLEKEDSTYVNLKLNPKLNYFVNQDLEEQLNKLLEYKWDDNLIPLFSNKDKKELENILVQFKNFNTLLKQKLRSELKVKHDTLFNTLMENIYELNIQLRNRLARQNNFIFVFQIVLVSFLIGWLILTIFILRQIKFDKKKLLQSQKKILAELKRNNFFLQKAQDISNLGYYTFNRKTRDWTASDFILNHAAYKSGDNILDQWEKIVHPEDRDVFPKIFYENTATDDFSFDLTYRIISAINGEVRWIHHIAGQLKDKENEDKSIVIGVMQDITQQKLIAINLEQSHQRFKSLFDQNPIALWEEDYSKVIQLLNDKQQEFGDLKTYFDEHPDFVLECVSSGKILNTNKTVLDLFEVADKEALVDHLNGSFNKGLLSIYKKGLLAFSLNKRTFSNEVSFVTKSGRVIDTFIKAVLVGGEYKVIFTINDITELKAVQDNLIMSERSLREAHDITGLGTFTFDGRISKFKTSSIFDKIVGVEVNYLDSIQKLVELSPPDDCQYLDKLFYNKEIVEIKKEFRIQRPKDKAIIWIYLNARKVYDKNFKLKTITGTIQDITQRKLAEEKLKQSDAILNRLNSLVMVNDNQSNMIYASPSVKAILGYEPEELLGQGWWNLTYESAQDAKKVQEAVNNYLYHDGPKTERVTYRKIKTKSGIERHIEWHISKGVAQTYISIGVDITSRYREEQIKNIIYNISAAAQKSPKLEDLLHFVKESLSVVIDTTDFYVALYNAKKQIFSLPYISGKDADLQGKTFPLGKSLTAYVLRKKKTTILTHFEFDELKRKGEVNLVGGSSKIWIGVPLIINKEVIGLLAVQSFTDINAFSKKDVALLELVATNISQVIKQAQDYESIHLLNTALIQSPASVVITDVDGNIEYVNPTFTKLSGYTYEEAIGQNPRILKSGNTSETDYKDLWKTLTSGKIWRGEFLNKRKDGSKYLVAVNIKGVKDNLGVITHYIGIQEDITEKRQLERDYLHAFIDAQEEEKQSFGEELHDGISQILAAEKMYIDILFSKKGISDAKKNEFLNKIKEHNLNAIIDTRRIAHGLMSKQLKEKGLLEAIKLICADYSNSKSIAISYKLKEIKESEIDKIIKTHLYRIFQEITTNITRHSGATKASVSFSKTVINELKLVIEDNGAGIDFEKMKREGGGAGLKNIERRVTLLNGKVVIDSILDKGTKFTITVPLDTSI